MKVESYRRRSALEVKRQRGRPASFATIKGNDQFVAERQLENHQTLVALPRLNCSLRMGYCLI